MPPVSRGFLEKLIENNNNYGIIYPYKEVKL